MATGPSGQVDIDLGDIDGGGGGVDPGDVNIDPGDIDVDEGGGGGSDSTTGPTGGGGGRGPSGQPDIDPGGDSGGGGGSDSTAGPTGGGGGRGPSGQPDIDPGGDSGGGGSDSTAGPTGGGGGRGPSGQPDVDTGGSMDGGDMPSEPADGGGGGRGPSGQPDIDTGGGVTGAPNKEPQGTAPTTPQGQQIAQRQREQTAKNLRSVPGGNDVDASDLRSRRISREGQPDVIKTVIPQGVRLRTLGGATEFQRNLFGQTADMRTNTAARQTSKVIESQEKAEEQVEQQFRQGLEEKTGVETAGLRRGKEFTVETGDGQATAELTPRGRRAIIRSQLAQKGEIQFEARQADVPLGGALGLVPETVKTKPQTRKITNVDQLQFGKEGNLVGVAAPQDPTFSENVAELRKKGVPGPLASVGAGTIAGFESAADAGSAAATAFRKNVGQPAAEFGGDVLGVGQDVALRSLGGRSPLEAFADPDTQASAADVARGEKQEKQAANFAERLGQKGSRGVTSIPEIALGLPGAAETGVKGAGGAAAFAAQKPVGESAAAAGAAVETAGRQVTVQSLKNPIRTTAQLVGTGAVFKGARAVGPRTSAATRGAIQPGEELLGKGGAATFRKAADAAPEGRVSSGLSKTGDVLFPRGEPIFASEEFAIAAGKKAAEGTRRAGQRTRKAVERFERPRVERQRVLTPEGLKTETDIDAGTLGAPVEAGRSAAGRVAQRARRARNELRDELTRRRFDRPEQQDVGDVTSPTVVDVEGGKARGAVVEEVPGQTGGAELGPFESEADGGDASGAGVGQTGSTFTEVETRTESGVAVEKVRVEQETEAEARTEGASELESVRRREVATESDLFAEAAVGSSLETDAGVSLEQAPLEAAGPRVDVRGDLEGESEVELRGEVELDQELRQELESELRRETETETEAELGAESELEVEQFDQREERRRLSKTGEDGEFIKRFQTGVASAEEILSTDEL